MFMKWWTGLSSNLNRRAILLPLAGLTLAVALSGCALLPNEAQEEDLPTITPPKLSQKTEYTVAEQTLETKVQAIGKLMSTQEETLFYTGGTDSNGVGAGDKKVKDVYVKTGDHVDAGQMIAELDVTDLERTLRTKQLQFRQQEIDMIKLLRGADQMDPAELEQKKIDFELQKAELDDMQQAIDEAKIKAPFAGTVVSLQVSKGDTVQSYDPIAIVADLSKLTVAAQLGTNDLNKVAVGMEAEVNINNAGTFKGKVERLPVKNEDDQQNNGGGYYGGGSNGQGNAGKQDSIDNYMVVKLDSFPKDVSRGTPLSVNVIVNRKEHAVVIPAAALRTHAGRNYVQVVAPDGTKSEVDVEVGQQTPTVVEILNGLKPGQKVVGQ